ncbi:MAG: hypothetical protein KJ749_15140, partial [Planctomycetes bacterium]|nr:hypothetical protein [Planctomycetota bacterium]
MPQHDTNHVAADADAVGFDVRDGEWTEPPPDDELLLLRLRSLVQPDRIDAAFSYDSHQTWLATAGRVQILFDTPLARRMPPLEGCCCYRHSNQGGHSMNVEIQL